MKHEYKRVLVTGGAGFIGSELVHQLSLLCEEVTVLDNLANGKRRNIAELLEKNVHLVVADIRDGEKVMELMAGTDVVFHLACLGVRHSIHSPVENHEVNATATLGLLGAARDAGVKRFVYVSSSEVYGTARHVPMPEEHPTFPPTVYGASKLAGECYARAFYETYGFPTVVIRPFNAYGPRCHHEGDSGEVIPKFLLRCMAGQPMVIFGDGTQTRDFTYVSDTARGIIMAAQSDKAIGETINLGSGFEITIGELACQVATVAEHSDAPILRDEPRPGDNLRLYADATKAKELLGFYPEIGLQEGLRRLRQWYLDSGQTAEALLEHEVVHNWRAK